MAQRRSNSKKSAPPSKNGPAKRKQKNPTQKTPQQRVMVLAANGKTHMIWRDWA